MNNSRIVREGFAREKVTDHKGSSSSQLGSPVRKVFTIQFIKEIVSRNVYFFVLLASMISITFVIILPVTFFGELDPAFLLAPTFFESRL